MATSTEDIARLKECHKRFLFAVRLLRKKEDKTGDEWYILACCLRIKRSFTATTILAKRGLTHDATGSLRAIFETIIAIAGIIRIEGFLERLLAGFKAEQIALTEIQWESGSYQQFETYSQLRFRLNDMKRELAEFEARGYRPYANNMWHTVAEKAGIMGLKKRYYKFLSLSAHPTFSSVSRYLYDDRTGESFVVNERPEIDDHSILGIYESLGNFLNIATSLLNDRFAYGLDIPTVQEILESL